MEIIDVGPAWLCYSCFLGGGKDGKFVVVKKPQKAFCSTLSFWRKIDHQCVGFVKHGKKLSGLLTSSYGICVV